MVIPIGNLGDGGATLNVSVNAPVTVNDNGGDPAQNRDLANRFGRAVEGGGARPCGAGKCRQLRPAPC